MKSEMIDHHKTHFHGLKSANLMLIRSQNHKLRLFQPQIIKSNNQSKSLNVYLSLIEIIHFLIFFRCLFIYCFNEESDVFKKSKIASIIIF